MIFGSDGSWLNKAGNLWWRGNVKENGQGAVSEMGNLSMDSGTENGLGIVTKTGNLLIGPKGHVAKVGPNVWMGMGKTWSLCQFTLLCSDKRTWGPIRSEKEAEMVIRRCMCE